MSKLRQLVSGLTSGQVNNNTGDHFIKIRAISGRDLVSADSNGKNKFKIISQQNKITNLNIGFSDPYLIITIGNEKRKTRYIKVN